MSTAVVNKIEAILHSSYNTKNYVDFINEIFPGVRLVAPDRFRKEFSNFSSHIEGSIHVGNYQTPDKKNIIILSVQLNKARYVENSRSTQRSYAKKLIENGNADAALIAFYTEGDPKWRLSFVRLDYEMKFENGKLKTAENMTPAKRYSYLVGEEEPCHTAISQFGRFITDSISNPEHPTLDDLENAFSVERVTDEFFTLYCEKFHELREQLEANEDFRIEAEQHNFTSAQFAKKLLGQIVFLYFLQKKGWLGVGAWPNTLTEKEYKNAFFARGAKSRELIPLVYIPAGDGNYKISVKGLEQLTDDDEAILAQCVKGKPWGSGPHNFMRILFNLAEKRNVNFFDELLEPLFYDALNVNRGEQGYCPALHCRIPFLSGGLFEPIDGYDWEHNDFAIPNSVFSNVAEKGSRLADGILDIFDRYNFTMSEDEPLEREVAIDPEMLGKVFENLLEVNDRKSKGAFYTPREIVHYMCQESLINYLATTMQVNEDAIRDFILYGDFMKDEDTVKEKREGNGAMYIDESLYKIDSDGKVIVNRLLDMDQALKDVRVADPAVGSGAFPLGMLNEIVRARQNISAYLGITMKPYDRRLMYQMERSPHTLKYETIRNCIFAADLEPSAVDIAQLRLWLSLVIDDEINPDAQGILDGHRNPLPLPNLESNILCGNSLIDEFEGTKLVNESDLLGNMSANSQRNLFQGRFDNVLSKLIEKQDELFLCESTDKKQQLKDEISALRDMVILSQLEGSTPDKIARYEDSKNTASKPYVLWQLDFARVFKEKGGFDIVIGNPPYIQLQKAIDDSGTKLGDLYTGLGFRTFAKTGDIYCLFYEKGYSLLHNEGILTFITSNKWMRAGYGKQLRGFFAEKTNPLILIDFSGCKIFESATVDVNILSFTKSANAGKTRALTASDGCVDNMSVYVRQHGEESSFIDDNSWIILSGIEQSIRAKINSYGTPLSDWDLSINYGIKTGFNDAFIISAEKREELIKEDPRSAEIIRPILRGRDIKRYGYQFAELYLIVSHNGNKKNKIPRINIDEYPAIKRHLSLFGEKLIKRADQGDTPFNLRNCVYMDDFSKQKIVWGNLCLSAQFALAEEDIYINAPSPMIVPGNKYILAILNSKVGDWYIRQLGVTRNGGYFEYKPMFVEKLPIPLIPNEKQAPFIALVDQILSCKAEARDTHDLEQKLDELAFDLYNLTKEEIDYILQA